MNAGHPSSSRSTTPIVNSTATSALRVFTVIPIALDRGATNSHTAGYGGKGTAGGFILVTDVYPPVRMGP